MHVGIRMRLKVVPPDSVRHGNWCLRAASVRVHLIVWTLGLGRQVIWSWSAGRGSGCLVVLEWEWECSRVVLSEGVRERGWRVASACHKVPCWHNTWPEGWGMFCAQASLSSGGTHTHLPLIASFVFYNLCSCSHTVTSLLGMAHWLSFPLFSLKNSIHFFCLNCS